jgi:TatD DNase family protein
MNLPKPGDYIDIHTHHAMPAEDIFAVENLMAHENLQPDNSSVKAYTAGIHPWHLNKHNREQLIKFIRQIAGDANLIAVGEAGFDKLRGPSMELQKSTFEEQVRIADEYQKPLIIHCVRAWDELLASHKSLKPSTKWLVHGFRGKKELASQLLSRGMYLSFWFDFALRPESADLFRFLPKEKIFFETDGADVDIREIYRKVADDVAMSVDELQNIILDNFNLMFLGNK